MGAAEPRSVPGRRGHPRAFATIGPLLSARRHRILRRRAAAHRRRSARSHGRALRRPPLGHRLRRTGQPDGRVHRLGADRPAAARGGLPVPFQISYGARGVGAAGLGWEHPALVRAARHHRCSPPADLGQLEPHGAAAGDALARGPADRADLQRRHDLDRAARRARPAAARAERHLGALRRRGPYVHVHPAVGDRRDRALAAHLGDRRGRQQGPPRVRIRHAQPTAAAAR